MTAPENGDAHSPATVAGNFPGMTSADGGATSSGLRGLQLPGPCLRSILRSYLSTTDRLHIFKTSRGLAAAVLQHADWGHEAQVEVPLQAGQAQGKRQGRSDQAAPGKITYSVTLTFNAQWEEGASDEQLVARQHVLQGLLCTAPGANIQVVLRKGITSMWPHMPACQVTRLSLVDLDLPAGLATMLPLQQCSKLRTLCLDNVQWDQQQGFNPSNLSEQQRAAFLAPALTHLEVHGVQTWGGLDGWAQLLGKQVEHLDITLGIAAGLPVLTGHATPSTLLALTHFATDGIITDQLLNDLAALPSLTHVTALGMHLSKSHTTKKLQWQQLSLGPLLFGVQHMQLQPIRCIVLRGRVCVPSFQASEALAEQLSSHLCVQCEPMQQGQFCLMGQYTAKLLSLCVKCLSEGTHFLGLEIIPGAPTELLAAIYSLPPQVMCLGLQRYDSESEQPRSVVEQEEQFLQHVARALPQHVQQVWLRTPACIHRAFAWVAAVLSGLATTERHVQVFASGFQVTSPNLLTQALKEHPILTIPKRWVVGQDRVLVCLAGKCTPACAAMHAPRYITQPAPP